MQVNTAICFDEDEPYEFKPPTEKAGECLKLALGRRGDNAHRYNIMMLYEYRTLIITDLARMTRMNNTIENLKRQIRGAG